MGFEWSRPTSFEDPVFTVGDGLTYYAVDHSPSLLWDSATWEISDALRSRTCRTRDVGTRGLGRRRDDQPRDRDPRRRRSRTRRSSRSSIAPRRTRTRSWASRGSSAGGIGCRHARRSCQTRGDRAQGPPGPADHPRSPRDDHRDRLGVRAVDQAPGARDRHLGRHQRAADPGLGHPGRAFDLHRLGDLRQRRRRGRVGRAASPAARAAGRPGRRRPSRRRRRRHPQGARAAQGPGALGRGQPRSRRAS